LFVSIVVRDGEGQTPLKRALDRQECDFALYLINHGFGGDEEKANLLCEACYQGIIDIVMELIEKHKIDPNGSYVTFAHHLL